VNKPNDGREHGRAFAQCSEESRAPTWLATVAAGLVHLSLFGAALYLSSPAPSHAARPPAQQLLEVELAPPPAAPEKPAELPPPEPPAPIKLKLEKSAPAPAPEEAPTPEKPPEATPPPAAAQAGAAVTQTAESAAPASDTLVTGSGASYAGGTTERGGSETQAVQAANARAAGVPHGTGDAPVDRSRAPRLAAGTDWSCPFPAEAEEEGLDHAVVGLEVEVSPSGALLAVSVQQDPGSGFGREARACALKKHWLPGLDKSGQPIQQKHRLNVTFTLR
jgi:protein TonB